MNKYSLILVFFVIAFSSLTIKAQDNANDSIPKNNNFSFEKGKEYILGGISVTGLKKFSEGTIKVYTGLKDGQAIKLPGDKLTSAIKKLYDSKQFSEVDVYLSKLDGETVYLQFDVTELPQLNKVTFTGLSKSKRKELEKETELKKGAMITDNLLVTSKNYIKKKYTDKGFLKTKVSLNTEKDTSDINTLNMNIHVDKGSKIKIKSINFKGKRSAIKQKTKKRNEKHKT
nr:POTRA domain-containing protein [Tenacibaculum aquimarinum]